MMKEDYEQAMKHHQQQEEEKYKLSIQYQEELERQLEEQVNYIYTHILHMCIQTTLYACDCVCEVCMVCIYRSKRSRRLMKNF